MHDPAAQIVGANLGIATFSPVPARLSAGIYKICTLLSTVIVENTASANLHIGRKPLPGAVFGGVTEFP
jgi:hypothetical protein